MARRTSSTIWNLGILLLVGGGIYWAWRSGALTQLSQALSHAMGGGGAAPSQNEIDKLVNQEIKKINDAIAKAQQAQVAQIADVVDKIKKSLASQTSQDGAQNLANWWNSSSKKSDTNGKADLAGNAAKLAWNALGVALPVWLGTTKQAADFTHQANVALTHAIGQKTGPERGNVLLMTKHGPLIVNKNTHKCYSAFDMLAPKEIPCPDPSEVTGIGLDAYKALIGEIKKTGVPA